MLIDGENRPEGNGTSHPIASRTWPLRNTPYIMTFHTPMAPLNYDHARRCIIFARSQVDSYIQRHGDRPIPGGQYSLIFDYRSVYFTIEPVDPLGERPLRYSDTVEVLNTYAAENTLEGFRERSAEVFVKDRGTRVATAFLGLADDDERKDKQFTLPNPYPMPGTAFSVNFGNDNRTGPALVSTAVVHCLNFIRRELVQHIDQTGNVQVSSLDWHVSDLLFSILPAQEHTGPQLLYQDLLALLGAFSKKMVRDGYQARHAQIFVTDGGQFVGNAQIAPEATGAQKTG